MRLFFHHSFETRCSRRQISFFISLLQRNSLRNESVRSKHRSTLAAAGSVLQSDRSNVTWSCAYLHAAEGGGGGGSCLGQPSHGSLVSRRAPLMASVLAFRPPWHWWTFPRVARSMPHSTNLALPHRSRRAMHHHRAPSSRGERLEESH